MDKQRIIGAALGMVFLLPLAAGAETDEEAIGKEPMQEKSLGQKIMDQYHDWKDHIAVGLGGYSGDTEADRRTYMEHYRNDLSDYHETMHKARADYRRARLDDQKAYLERHNTLPIPENIEQDSGPLR